MYLDRGVVYDDALTTQLQTDKDSNLKCIQFTKRPIAGVLVYYMSIWAPNQHYAYIITLLK